MLDLARELTLAFVKECTASSYLQEDTKGAVAKVEAV
jgi:hypothetical protein